MCSSRCDGKSRSGIAYLEGGEEGSKRKSGEGFDGWESRGLITRSAVLVVR